MENQLSRIGAMIFDLRRGITIAAEKENLEDLEREFAEIMLILSYLQEKKVPGYGYQLDFHKAEAQRLLDIMTDIEDFQTLLADTIDTTLRKDNLREISTELIVNLSEFCNAIEIMNSPSALSQRNINPN